MFTKSSNCTYVRQNTGNCCRDDMLLETGAFKRTKQFRQAFLYHVTKTIRHLETNRNILMLYIVEFLYVHLGVLKTILEKVSYI